MWINARTDVFLAGTGRIDDALERSAAYAAAGADSLLTYDSVAEDIAYDTMNDAITATP